MVVGFDEVFDDVFVLFVVMMGVFIVMVEKFLSFVEVIELVKVFGIYFGCLVMYIVCVEVGGVNLIILIVVVVVFGFLFVDVDGMGCVFFEL